MSSFHFLEKKFFGRICYIIIKFFAKFYWNLLKKFEVIAYISNWAFFGCSQSFLCFLNMSFTNIWALCSNFFDCESFLESNSPDILALCEANLDDSVDSGNFSVRSYLPLLRKDSSTHMHGLTVHVKEGLAFAWDLSLENSTDSYVFTCIYFTQYLSSFSSIDHLFCLCAWFLILFYIYI